MRVDCVVIDSYPALVTEREDKGTIDDFQPGEAAVLTGKFLGKSNMTMKAPLNGVGRSLYRDHCEPMEGEDRRLWKPKNLTWW